ncbi:MULTISPECIES: response regulator transcription factor [unclassified Neptuniibacter]|jgi:DNA-binding NarL/FixJ family response regulator|uniref:response regulator n=1 Tax=unclassified Neptuniibacter TaxID=2630693 RepID=UPI0026E14476|nr:MULTISPECIES: response regulator transcription factor [unclassified Neptuniibacter]MDO6514112.1 response regulator transcription factor [Neptuniibacter sp. 2_MG-2023]MDO6594051.1 response regulator transcription factor [Neptuniibacter sp. 1_MG-2023]
MGLINILLVDDHAIVREGYRSLLNKQPSLNIIAEAESGEDAYVLYRQHKPDLLILDLSLPGKGGLATLIQIRQLDPKAKVLVFSMHQNPSMAKKVIEAGAKGYITKSSAPAELIQAVMDVVNGRLAISEDIARAIAMDSLHGKSAIVNKLSTREYEILRMLVEGKTKADIAETLSISVKTVSNAYYIIKSKLEVKTDLELMHAALQARVVSVSDYL